MATVITNTMLSAIDARLKKMAFEAPSSIKMIYPNIFKTTPTDRAYEIVNRVIGVDEASVVSENGIFPEKEIKQDSSKTITMKKFGFRISVSRELIMDNLFQAMQDDVSRAMANSMAQTKERRSLNVLNNGFTTQQAQDGVALFSTSHPLIQGGTQSNKSSVDSALDLDSLWSGRNTMKTTQSNSTLYDQIYDAKYIVVPQQLERRANELVKSEWIPQATENTANVIGSLNGNLTVLTSPLLTSSTAWFLIADPSNVPEFGLRFFEREALSINALFNVSGDAELGIAIDKDVYTWRCRERYEVDAVTWYGLYGNAGA
jgi:hypothetical protein